MLMVITGVSKGLGRAMVDEFIAEGHLVVGCARSESAVVELQQTYGEPHRFNVVDVADANAVESWATSVIDSHGAPDYLINNAAMMNQSNMVWDVSADEFKQLMDVNVCGAHHMIRSFVPAMIDNSSGIIVNFSSGWGRSTSPEVGPYCASKYAIEGLTSALSQELPNGIAAVALNPGIIDTEMLQKCWGGSTSQFPTPKQWAESAVPFILNLTVRDNGGALSVR